MNELFDVLIADDEYLVRERIKRAIDWESEGFRIVFEAEDGEKALQIIKKHHPALVVADINMPFMSGLKLAGCIKDLAQGSKTILLTGYDDFEYAREAIRSSVTNYLLKPLNREELLTAIRSVRSSLNRERNRIIEKERIETYLTKYRIREDLADLLKRGLDKEEILAGHDPIFFLREESFLSISLISNRFHIKSETLPVEDNRLIDAVTSYFNGEASCFFTPWIGSDLILLIRINGKSRERAESRLQWHIRSFLRKNYPGGFPYLLGTGRPVPSIGQLSESCKEAETAIVVHLMKEDFARCPAKGDPSDALEDGAVEKMISEIKGSFHAGKMGGIRNVLDQHIEEIGRHKDPYFLINYFQKVLLLFENIRGRQGPDSLDLLRNFRTLKEINAFLKVQSESLLEGSQTSEERRKDLIKVVKNIIESNYSDSGLSIKTIAEQTGVHPNYLSGRFKEVMGMNFVSYVHSVRLAKARSLLKKKNLKCQDIAWVVGYKDPYYFSRCYKKQYGISPQDEIRAAI